MLELNVPTTLLTKEYQKMHPLQAPPHRREQKPHALPRWLDQEIKEALRENQCLKPFCSKNRILACQHRKETSAQKVLSCNACTMPPTNQALGQVCTHFGLSRNDEAGYVFLVTPTLQMGKTEARSSEVHPASTQPLYYTAMQDYTLPDTDDAILVQRC